MGDNPVPELFGDNAPTSGDASNLPSNPPPNQPDPADKLGILVGEGRKYKTVNDLANAYLNADGHITQLQEENRVLREQATKGATLDDVLAQLKSQRKPDEPPASVSQGTPLVDAASIGKLVKEAVVGIKTEEQRQQNINAAKAGLAALFGEKAKEVFERETPTPALRDAMTRLAEADPARFVAFFKPADKAMPPMQVSSVNLNAPTQTNRADDPGTKEYWNALRKSNPTRYYSADGQLAREKAARQNPDKYFGRT